MILSDVEQIIKNILYFFDIENSCIDLLEEEEYLRARIKIDNAGFLIGNSGNNLNDLEYLIRLILRQKGFEKRFSLDINNYRWNQEEKLREFAKKAAKKAVLTRGLVELSSLNAYERRIIHSELASNPNIKTESVGEGEKRILIVKLYYLD